MAVELGSEELQRPKMVDAQMGDAELERGVGGGGPRARRRKPRARGGRAVTHGRTPGLSLISDSCLIVY